MFLDLKISGYPPLFHELNEQELIWGRLKSEPTGESLIVLQGTFTRAHTPYANFLWDILGEGSARNPDVRYALAGGI